MIEAARRATGARTPGERAERIAVLHQGFVPTYRVAFYELLNERSARDYVIFHGEPPAGRGHRAATGPFDFPNLRVRSVEVELLGRSAIYQRVLRELWSSRYDGVVLGTEVKFVSNVALFALYKGTGRPVVLWGQGFEKDEDVRGASARLYGAGGSVKALLAGVADGYLAYTTGGAEHLAGAGVPRHKITVVGNTLDMSRQVQLHGELQGADEWELRDELRLASDSAVLVFLGRVYREKRLDELLDAARTIESRGLTRKPVEVVVIGDGPELEGIRARAAGGDRVHFLGGLYDQEAVARYLRVASAVVIPGKVGLAVNHAFAHGVPVITRESRLHAAEAEYIIDGVNGLRVEGDLETFASTLAAFVDLPARQETLAREALATRGDLTLEAMVRAFDGGVERALRRDTRRR